MPAMRSDGIARLCRYQCPTRAVLVVLIPTGLGRALRRQQMPPSSKTWSVWTSSPRSSWHCSGSKAAFARLPDYLRGEPILAHAPEAVTRTQPEPFIVSTLFLRPLPSNWQVVCGIYPQSRRVFALLPRLFTG